MILVVRSAPQLPHTLDALQRAGHTDLLPLAISTINPLPPATLPDGTLVLTSANATGPWVKGRTVMAVGEATAAAAKNAGATIAFVGNGDGEALAAHLATLPPQPFVHLHGTVAGLGWHAAVRAHGHTLAAVPVYQTEYVPALPAEILRQLRQTPPSYTLLFSEGGAKHLLNLLQSVNMQPWGTAVALSPKVAQVATPFPRAITPPQPNLPAILNLLTQHRNAA